MSSRQPNYRTPPGELYHGVRHTWPADRAERVELALCEFQCWLAIDALFEAANERTPRKVLDIAGHAVEQLQADGIPETFWDTAEHYGEIIF